MRGWGWRWLIVEPVGFDVYLIDKVRSLAVVNWLDVLWGEVANVSMATTSPAQGIRAVEEFNDITTQEA